MSIEVDGHPPLSESLVSPNPDVAAEHKYQFNVSMSCGGCSGAIDRVLKRMEGAFLFP